ncbi:MAG: hypothetical protein DRJ09_10160, partial [Bacteroidetes bacterium]
VSLFGEIDDAFTIKDPEIPVCKPWSQAVTLKEEKEVTGFYISGHPLDDHKIAMRRFCSVQIDFLKNNLKSLKNKSVTFGGMVIEAIERQTKKGSAFGIFTLEDFSGSIRLMVFSEQYLRIKHLIFEGAILFVSAKVEARFNDETNLQVQVKEVMLMEEVLEKKSHSVLINLSASEVNEEFTNKLIKATREKSGKTPLAIQLWDPEEKRSIKLKSITVKIDPAGFIADLEKLNISYKLL